MPSPVIIAPRQKKGKKRRVVKPGLRSKSHQKTKRENLTQNNSHSSSPRADLRKNPNNVETARSAPPHIGFRRKNYNPKNAINEWV